MSEDGLFGVDYATLTWVTAIPTGLMIMGMCLVQFWSPHPKITALMQHFAAGVVSCAVACEMLPVILDEEYSDLLDYLGILIGFAVGVMIMLVIARLIPSHQEFEEQISKQDEVDPEEPASCDPSKTQLVETDSVDTDCESDNERKPLKSKESGQIDIVVEDPEKGVNKCAYRKAVCIDTLLKVPWGLIVPVATDAAIDGLLIGITYVGTDFASGLVMAIALAIEDCFLGMSTSNQMTKNELPRAVGIPICMGLPILIMLFGYLGAAILSNVSGPIFVGVISFGMAALLFLVSDELLIEAHKDKSTDTWWVTCFFFVGFGTIAILQKVLECNLGGSSTSSSSLLSL